MSTRAPAWFETKYIDGVTHRLQSKGWLLKPATRGPDEVRGNTVIWKRAGMGEAQQASTSIEDASSMNLDRDTVQATMVDWEANDWIKKRDLEKMSQNEQAVVQQSGAMAIGRRFDRIVMGAFDAEGGTILTVGDGSTAISPVNIMDAQGQIFNEGSGAYEYWCAIPSIFMQQLELYREFSSADWVADAYPLLKQIGARRYRGINVIPLPSHPTNAAKNFFNIPAANQMDGYMWVDGALGMASSNSLESRIDYIATKKAWFAANDMSACAKVILPEGVRRLRFATNVALSRPTP
ncbi:hypothetical protein BA190_26875 [Labrys sp. WJW]|uniref:phage capsid protein n=1 Tax=Labrys sp. WJW TaxID=1737983 RepID=UPI000833D42E|nr:phage capsid protein [Labrys sp. WJW]OCC01839.1 hypothetical protein BA190_26875 [Labrys sp. WJW]